MDKSLKISELIEKLTALKELHGDLPVWGCVDDIGANGPDFVKEVCFVPAIAWRSGFLGEGPAVKIE